eukprot:6335946-Pyramimonas_sp.AAC.1
MARGRSGRGPPIPGTWAREGRAILRCRLGSRRTPPSARWGCPRPTACPARRRRSRGKAAAAS